MKQINLGLVVLLCSVLGCCVEPAKVTLYGTAGPARPNNAELMIFSKSLPDRPYVEIGEIITSNRDEQTNMEQIRTEARKMGADAVILQGAVESKTESISTGGSRQYGLKAVAIRWKK